MCTNLGKQPCSEDTYVTERCVKCTQPGHAKDWQTETEVTHSNTQAHGGFTSGHCMYKPGETFSEDTYVTERCVKYKQEEWKTDRQKRKENTLWYHSRPHARGGVNMHPDPYPDPTWGNIFERHIRRREVCEMQTGHAKDWQTKMEGKHTNSHAHAGVLHPDTTVGKHSQRTHTPSQERGV